MAVRQHILDILIRARDQASNVLTGVIGKTTALASAIGAFFGLRFLQDAVDSAREFEAQMSVVQAKSGATAEDMAALTRVAQEMGSSTRYSATEAAQGLEILATAGVSAADSVKLLPTVLQTAQGAGISLAEAAGIITGAMGILGKSIEETAHIADVLSKGALLANTNVSELGLGLKVAGGAARAAGLDMEQTVAALDVLAANAVKGAEAGTALRNLLNELRNPASAARQALLQLGITTGDLPTVLQQLEGNAAGISTVLDALTVDAQIAGRALFQAGVEGFGQFDESLRAAGGTAQKTAEVMDKNLNGALAGLGSAWDGLKQALTTPLLEPIAQQITALAGAIQRATTDGTIDGFRDSLLGAFNAAAEGVRQFLREFDFRTALDNLGDFARGAVESLRGVSAAISSMANAARLAWNVFQAGVEGVTAAVTKLPAAFIQSYGKLLETLDLLGLVPDRIKNSFIEAGNFLQELSSRYAEAARQDLAEAGRAWDALTGKIDRSTQATQQATIALEERRRAEQAAIKAAEAAEKAVVARINAEIKAKEAIEQRAAADRQAVDAIKAQTAEIARLQQIMQAAAQAQDWQAWYDAWQELQRIGQQATEAIADGAGEMSQAVREAFKTLGISTQAELETAADTARQLFEALKASGEGTAEDLKRAFLAYAEAAREAAALSSDAVRQSLETDLQREAAVLGIAEAKKKEAAATDAQVQAQDNLTRAVKDTTAEVEEEGEAVQQAASGTGAFVARVITHMYSLSQAVGDAFTGARQETTGLSGDMQALIAQLERAENLFQASREQAGISARFDRWLQEANQLQVAYYEQRLEVQRLEEALRRAMQAGTVTTQQLDQAAQAARGSFDLLDDQHLENLRAAVRDARAEIQGMEQDARRAAEAIEEELLRAQGQQDVLLQREYDKRRRAFEVALEAAQQAGNQEASRQYQQALADLRKLHQIRLDNLKEEHETANQFDRERRQGSTTGSTPARGTGAGGVPERTVRLEFANQIGQVVGAGDFSPDQATAVEALLNQLVRARGTALQ